MRYGFDLQPSAGLPLYAVIYREEYSADDQVILEYAQTADQAACRVAQRYRQQRKAEIQITALARVEHCRIGALPHTRT